MRNYINYIKLDLTPFSFLCCFDSMLCVTQNFGTTLLSHDTLLKSKTARIWVTSRLMFICRIIEVETDYIEDGVFVIEHAHQSIVSVCVIVAETEYTDFSVLS